MSQSASVPESHPGPMSAGSARRSPGLLARVVAWGTALVALVLLRRFVPLAARWTAWRRVRRAAEATAVPGVAIRAAEPATWWIPTGKVPDDRSIAGLVAAELPPDDAVRMGESGKNWLEHPPRDLFGLALSGGGIRSATFNLGLLQGLHDLQLLRAFDYVSTVSGGGYLGAWWTAWRHRKPWREGRFPSDLAEGFAEPPEVRHLREFSNFLAPRLGIFSYDTGRLLVNALSSMLPSLLAALSVITLALLGWVGCTWLLFADTGSPLVAPAVMLGLTAATLIVFEVAWLERKEPTDGAGYPAATLLGLGLTGGAWATLAPALGAGPGYPEGQRLPGFDGAGPDAGTYLLAPAAAWGAALLTLVVLRWFLSLTGRWTWGRHLRRATDRVRARILLLAVAWTAIAALWMAGVLLELTLAGNPLNVGAFSGFTAVLAAAFVKIQQLLAREKQPSLGGGKLLARIKPLLPQLLAYAVVVMAVVGVAALIVAAGRDGGVLAAAPWQIAAGAALVTALVLVLMDPNEVGFHSFYRARLARAYSGASNNERIDPATGKSGPNRETEEVEGDDILLKDLGQSARRPFHLVCLAANDLASRDDMANLSRGATSAVLSAVGCSVGDQWAPWEEYREPATLGAAVTASGAAFNTLMGSKSRQFGPAVTFLMAALNLRLGMWVANPAHATGIHRRRLAGAPFYSEMFGLASATGRQVHLSDGAHFENLAVYELIRRHCRVILASDCGQDGDSAFDDLGNLVRRVREDFGVDVRIDTRPVRPGGDGLSAQYMVAGDIHYPDGDTGVLLFFKPALVGGEPADVTQYRTRNAAFPHESTVDQFYGEAQWESYRRLGEHAVRTAFGTVLDGLELDRPGRGDRELRPAWMEAFARARREWFPEPEGYDERLSRFADRVAELEGALREPGCEVLLRQVYKELDELDQQQRQRQRVRLAPNVAVVAGGAPGVGDTAAGARGGSRRAPAARAAAPGAGEAAARDLPAPEQQGPALHLIRRALLLMEEVFESEDLDRNYSHPLYLGVMNWFARWAYAPLLRMWWPLLKTLYPQRYTRFLEKHFSLTAVDHHPGGGEEMFTWIHKGGDGFARACWVRQGKDPAPREREVISYSLRMVYRDQEPYRIQAAQVVAERTGGTLAWDAGDFFVPAGLWGVGIGSDFLKKLHAGSPALSGVWALVVRVAADPAEGAAGKRWAANEMQLYRTAGFREADLIDGRLWYGTREIALPERWMDATRDDAQWMVAMVTSPPATAPAAAAASTA